MWVVKTDVSLGAVWRRGFKAGGLGRAVDVRSRVERVRKGAGLIRDVMGLERRLRVRRLGRLARGDKAEKEVMALEASERLVRWVVGGGRGGAGRLFEASERVVSAGKEGRRESIYSTTLVDRRAWVGEE